MMRKLQFAAAAALALVFGNALAEAFQDQDSILETAVRFARQAAAGEGEVEIEPGRLDPRLRLALCDRPLEAFSPPGGRTLGNTTVGVRCNGSRPWTLYVPVTINLYDRVVVAATPLAKGEILDRGKVKLARYNLARLPQGYFHEVKEVEGKLLRRNLAAGQALVPSMVKAPRLIRRGQRVTMLAGGNGLEVRVPGEALANGARGERIRVRNLSSRRVVEGVVVNAGVVRVDL